ncbi:hypothetical protein FPV67DRAFT_1414625 [Lyophyllum atratum]|nr:hypothetical protein FPV67DRAFT_1414625 [Lyophyllum atratum]
MEDVAAQDGVFSAITLPCGRSLQNRLVKVAMYEHLAGFTGGPPNKHHYSLYSKWAEFDWGMVITGNVQVSNTHLTLGRDIILPRDLSEESLRPFKQWVSSMQGSSGRGGLKVMQLSHAGRQSTNFIGGRYPFQRPFAPSSIRVKAKESGWLTDTLHALAFQTPLPMSVKDIDDLVEAFVKGAIVASESRFDGVQLHAAHGYLLAQFISPTSNERTDDYSASPDNALRLLHRVVSAIRAVVAKDFILGIKLNAADYAVSDEVDKSDRILDHFRAIALWGEVDFIEVSGGDYEKPEFMTTSSPRQALFSRFSKAAMDNLESLRASAPSARLPLILLTGGLRTPELLHTALTSRHAHLLGIGRGSVLCPDLPRLLKQRQLAGAQSYLDPGWSSPFRAEPDLTAWSQIRRFLPTVPLVGAGINMAWYIVEMRRLAAIPSPVGEKMEELKPKSTLGPLGAVLRMWFWVDWTLAGHVIVLLLAVPLLFLAIC